MEYKLVRCQNDFVLEKEVNELLKEGWKCQGGINFYYYEKDKKSQSIERFREFAQAMVKE